MNIEEKCQIDMCEQFVTRTNQNLMWGECDLECPIHGVVGWRDTEFGHSFFFSKESYENRQKRLNSK